eukprot:SM005630S18749  [mRNA]  locus=s5630:95:977:- [translate_table: standard]
MPAPAAPPAGAAAGGWFARATAGDAFEFGRRLTHAPALFPRRSGTRSRPASLEVARASVIHPPLHASAREAVTRPAVCHSGPPFDTVARRLRGERAGSDGGRANRRLPRTRAPPRQNVSTRSSMRREEGLLARLPSLRTLLSALPPPVRSPAWHPPPGHPPRAELPRAATARGGEAMAMRLPWCSGAGGDDDLVSSGSSPQPSPEKGVAPPLPATIIAQGPAQAPVMSSAPSPLVNLQLKAGPAACKIHPATSWLSNGLAGMTRHARKACK